MADIDADEVNDSQSQSDTPEYDDPDPDGQTSEQENEVDSGSGIDDADVENQEQENEVDSGSGIDDADVENQEQDPESILEEKLELYNQTDTLWNDSISDLSSKKLLRHIKTVRMSYTAFDYLHSDTKDEFCEKLVSSLIQTGTLRVVCDILVRGLQDNTYCEATSNRMRKRQEAMMSECLMTVNCFIGSSQESNQILVYHEGLLPMLVKKLDEWYTPHVEGMQLGVQENYINRSLTTLFLVSAAEEKTYTNYLRDIDNFVSVIRNYLSSKVEDNRLTAIALLANLAQEAETEDIATDKDMVRFLLDQLQEAFTNKNHESSSGWTRIGLVQVVKNLAMNAANKQLLVKEGALPLLEDGLKPEFQSSTNNVEKKCCLESLWSLSFDSHNRLEMMKIETLLQLVVGIYREEPTSDSFGPAEGILYQLRSTLPMKFRLGGIENPLLLESERKSKFPADQKDHVMISYQTQYRPVVRKIYDFLQQKGVKMWMDIHNMSKGVGSTLETMAEAVEGAKVVLMCVSESYKNSPYCRQEAEYAFEEGKLIIPLYVQRGYKPNGWLGLLRGSKYFYNFARDDPEYTEAKKLELYDTICMIYASEVAR